MHEGPVRILSQESWLEILVHKFIKAKIVILISDKTELRPKLMKEEKDPLKGERPYWGAWVA